MAEPSILPQEPYQIRRKAADHLQPVLLLPLAALLYLPLAQAQQLSVDGEYWYEVEVTIFSSRYTEQPYSEIPVPERSNLRYLPQLRLLQNPGDSYQVVFASPQASPPLTPQSSPIAGVLMPRELPVEPVVLEGPVFSPAVPGSFKVTDYLRDAFVALDRRAWRFTDINNRLQSNGEHRVLWHRMWRQPMRARGQTSALQVQGGDAFGDHYQLEGSLRFSGQNGQANVDINVWLSSFVTSPPVGEAIWQLPEMPDLTPAALEAPPLPPADTSQVILVPANVWYPNNIWQLNQTREVGPATLYYLDHPAMGVLVEIRPYELPELELPLNEAPSATNNSGFE